MSTSKLDALDRLGPRWRLAIDDQGPVDLDAAFGRRAPRLLDVGFGSGTATLAAAAGRPDRQIVAVDVHTTGVAHLLRGLDAAGLANVRIAEMDVWELLPRLAAGSLDEIRLLFPDPWPKRRHHHRRLVQPGFVAQAAALLRPGGRLHLATDCDGYAAPVRAALAADTRFTLFDDGADGFSVRPPRPVTRYERQGLAAGRPIRDLVAVRT